MAMQIIGSNSIGTGIRADLGTDDDIIVLAGSAIGSTNNSAIVGSGIYQRAEIYGSAVAAGYAIQLGDNPSLDNGNKVWVHEDALVFSSYAGIWMNSYAGTVVNEGSVEGYIAVLVGGRSASSTTITNSGVLHGDNVAITRFSESTDKLVVNNSGLIEGSFSISADGYTAVEEINNTGSIRGTMYLYGGDDLYNGAAGRLSGFIDAGDGNDRLYGGVDNDHFYGGSGADTLKGNAGNDILNGAAGADRMEGGAGHDTFYVDDAYDVVVELSGQGADTVQSALSYTLGANVENLILSGSVTLSGTGNSLANSITGNSAANTLKGLAGNDKLTGNDGADQLHGGTGGDLFIFTALSDSDVASSGRDTIYDFSHAQGDRIHLSTIDANTSASDNQTFAFIGEKSSFTGKAGELRYVNSGGDTFIYGDVNGDKVSDFAIRLDADINLVAGDFIL